MSDNGPQLRVEFKEFCKQRDTHHETSSPYYPRFNRLAESSVKICKHLMKKVDNDLQLSASLLGRILPE